MKRSQRLVLIALLGTIGFLGCEDNSGSASSGGSTIIVTEMDGAVGQADGSLEEDLGAIADMAPMTAVDQGAPPLDSQVVDMAMPDAAVPVDQCEALGFTKRDFYEGGIGGPSYNFGALAGDFSVTTLRGEWSLRAEWSGCDSYVFLTHFPDLRGNPSGAWFGDLVWGSQLEALALTSPKNVHYFFISYERAPAARAALIEAQQTRFEQTLVAWLPDEGERDHWRARVHFVTDRASEIEGSVGGFVTDYMNYLFDPSSSVDLGGRGMAQAPLPFAFAIDRQQRWDSVGTLSPHVGASPEWSMVAYSPHFYNHKAALEERDSNEEVTKVELIDEDVTARHIVRTGMLPDAAAMANFDTLFIDIEVHCPHRNVFACSEWDRIGRVMFCLDPECMEQREIARWITPYWRRGTRRWMIDASPFLGLMSAGGEQTFRLVMGPNWERGTERKARFELRLSSSGKGRALGAERVYQGGGFNAEYNMNHGPVSFAVPAEAARAELVVILSGHGQSDGNNCSEWCDHRHDFAVNGNPIGEIRSELPVGSMRGCADKAGEGVPPGQYGNWAQGRAYWCPGWPVDALRFDITEHLTASEMEQLTYSANLAGGQPGGGNIDLSAYIVWYAADE